MKGDKWYQYRIEVFNKGENEVNPTWKEEYRYYLVKKDLSDDDLKDIPNKRRNAYYCGEVIEGIRILDDNGRPTKELSDFSTQECERLIEKYKNLPQWLIGKK